ncbi:MAG: hypothetical protein QM737_05205 [Ferruginibacter sp.]
MKKIIIKLSILILILFTSDRLIAYFFSGYVFKYTMSGESGGSINYLIKNKKNIDFLIMGSSRAKHHINPALLSDLYGGNGYNAGLNGTGGVVYANLLLNLLIDKGIVPKMLVLQTDAYPYYLNENSNIYAEIATLYPFINESNKLKKLIEENTDYAEKIKLALYSYRFNGKFLNIIYNYPKRNSIKDNTGFEGRPEKLDTTGFRLLGDNEKPHKLSAVKLKALQNIIQTCKDNNIKLAIVLPPSYRNNIYWKAGNDAIIDVMHKNGVNNIYDFSDVNKYPALQPKEMWKDITHLNNDGATLFSLMINDSLKHFR